MLDIQTTDKATVNNNNPFLKLKTRHLLFWFLIINIVSSFAVFGIFNILNISQEDPLFIYVFYSVTFILTCSWLLKRFKDLNFGYNKLLKRPPQGYRWLKLVGLIGILVISSLGWGLFYFYFLSLIAPSWFENVMASLEAQNPASSSFPIVYNILTVFSFVIIAPIAEEFIFRGFLLNRWATKWNLHLGIILSSVVFGCLHVNPIGISIFGIILCLLYIKTKTLIVPIVAHAINNAVSASLMLLGNSANSDTSSSLSSNDIFTTWDVSLWLIAISTPFIFLFIYKNWPSSQTQPPYYNLIKKVD